MKSNMKISVPYIKRISLILLLSIVSLPMLKAQFTVSETFQGSNITGDIQIGGHATLTSGNADPANGGWLRLTPDQTNRGGYAYIKQSFPTNLGVYMEFEYKAWRTRSDGHWGADGFSVFFFDAEYGGNTPFRLGQYGGSLGYAPSNHENHSGPGLGGAYLGIGLDEYGNFANASEGKDGMLGEQANAVSLRGPAAHTTPYRLLTSTAQQTPNPLGADKRSTAGGSTRSIDYDQNSNNSYPQTRVPDSRFYRKVKVYIEPQIDGGVQKYKIRVLWRTSPSGPDIPLVEYLTEDPIPEEMRLGFAASTGGGYNFHEVRNLYATTTGGVRVQKQVDKGFANPNEEITYTITVANEEVDAITGANYIMLSDVLKDIDGNTLTTDDFEITGITFNNNGKTGSTAQGFPHGQSVVPTFPNGELTFSSKMTIAGQSEATFTIKGKAKDSMKGKVVQNKVDLDVENMGFVDSDYSNNTATVNTTILNPDLDLSVTKMTDNNGVAKSSGNVFTILVTNNSTSPKAGGTDSQHEVKITDVVPAGLTVTGYNAPDWTRTGTGNNFTFTRRDGLGAQQSYPVITINVTPTAGGGPWTNTAKLDYRAAGTPVTKESSATLKWINLWLGAIGANGTDWATASNWTVGVPASGDNIEFATEDNNEGVAAKNDLHVNGIRIIGDLTNATTKNLVIPTNQQLTINGRVVDTEVAGGTIIVQAAASEATGSLIFGNPTINTNVDATVQFYNKAYTCDDCGEKNPQQWQYFGIPVSESDGGVFPLSATVNKWSEGLSGNKWVALSSSDNLTAFTGYEINDAVNATPLTVYNFSGKLNVGNKTINLTKSNNVNYSGWNLIANSYTGAIPITSDAIQYNNGQNFGVYLFNTGSRHEWRKMSGNTVSGIESGRYTVVPSQLGGQGQLPDRIPSMHAFMIKAENAGTLTLDYSKLLQNTTDTNQPAWRSASQPAKLPYIVMDVIGTESADRVWLFENRSTTRGFDAGWDGEKMVESGLLQLYVAGDEDLKLQVATVPQLEGTFVGLKPTNNENTTVSFSVSTDVEPRGLYLRDMLTGRSYPIRNNNEYTLPGVAGEHPQRFKVVSVAQGEGNRMMTDSGPVEIFIIDRRFAVTNKTSEICVATVFDIMGRVVAKQTIENNATQQINTSGRLPDGVYVIRVKGNSVDVSKRVMLK